MIPEGSANVNDYFLSCKTFFKKNEANFFDEKTLKTR